MRDRAAFLRPIAHRGLHDAPAGVIENSLPAFEAAISAGYGIECDVRATSDHHPIIFHDDTFDRLPNVTGPVAERAAHDLREIKLDDSARSAIPTLAEGLACIGGRVPLLIEIKSDWTPPNPHFLEAIATAINAYRGPVAVMSFDPSYIAPFREFSPDIPRGIVSGRYAEDDCPPGVMPPERAARMRDCLEAGPAAPDFIAYEVGALPTPVITFARSVARMPVFAWTVRTARDLTLADIHADSIIFEGFRPEM